MKTPSFLDAFFHKAGRGVLRVVSGRYLALPQSFEPTADADFRGAMFVKPGGAGVADALMFCRKNAADAYECASVDLTP